MTEMTKAERLRQRRNRPTAIDPDAPVGPPLGTIPAPTLAAEPAPAPVEPPAEKPPPPPPARSTGRSSTRSRRKPAEPKLNALEDPDCHPGEKDYRSFYLEDSIYFRYRAAIYWASRNPDAEDDVPENMTAGVEEFMLDAAADLERRFNGGEPFRMPPATKRRGRTARKRRTTGQ